MKTLRITGLEDQGPGDILGAITNEAEIPGELVGDIRKEGKTAEVEIDSNVAGMVVEKVDGNKIGKT
ncbi:MAG: DbpA RNA binding domain-containing protein, partial [Candidatus Nanohaloarchaeota archaeon QJJ-9]|nr:DbpA RNA binding domain-containing protein [Candidatus Nanohaloarchaeota archaeon QJJ-9]